MSLSYTKLVGRDASFQLVRTNPKLTSNVKLTVDSDANVWLNSIPADPELAKDQYQRFSVDTSKSHEFNIFKFYNKGKTPSKIAYRIGTKIIQNVTAKDLKNQYDFDFYTSGAKYLESKQYAEKFSYFAPLYLNKVLPDTFVIFKAKGPSNYTAGSQLSANVLREQYALDFFKSFQLVKAFDMSPNSKIGKYLEKIIENPMRPNSPLSINFNSSETSYSYYNGLSISAGTYVQLPVNTNSVFTRGLPLLTKEEFIVQGFESNSIIHPSIINMEFLFNDDTSKDFEINRYFGFYCNRIDLAEFDIDLDAMYNNPNDNDQPLDIKRTIDEDVSIRLTNDNGVKLRGKNLSANVGDLNKSLTDHDNLFFAYLETNKDVHLIKSGSWNQANEFVDFSIDDTMLDIGTMFGPGEIFSQEQAKVSEVETHSTLCAKIVAKPENGRSIKLYHSTATKVDATGRYDEFLFIDSAVASNGSFAFNEPGKWLVEYTAAGEAHAYVSADGTIQDIATALCGAINALRDSGVQALTYSNYCFIQIKAAGESFGVLRASDNTNTISLIGTKIGDYVYADGGTVHPHPIIDAGAEYEVNLPLEKMNEIKDSLLVKTDKNWSKISRISRVTDNIFPGQSEQVLKTATSNFLRGGTFLLTDDETPLIAHGGIELRKIVKNKVGIFSIFEIKDFDFYQYTTSYSRLETLDLFKDFFEPTGIKTLKFREYAYLVVGKGTIEVNGIQYTENQYVWQNTDIPTSYRVINGDCALIKSSYSPNGYLTLGPAANSVDSPLQYSDLVNVPVEDQELKNYTGQFSVRTPAIDLSYSASKYGLLNEYRDKFLQGAVLSEYLVNLEHQSVAYAIKNKLTPYINKWGLRDSSDVRANQYRLNTDLIFGKDNFGPSHNETFPSAEKLTHEWFYVESDFGFNLDPALLARNYNYFETPFDVSRFQTDSTYFDEYFQYVPIVDDKQIERVQLRYSDLYRDPNTGQFETVFRGAKYRFFELSEARMTVNPDDVADAILSITDRFQDYRFSTILKVVHDYFEDSAPPVRFEIIENIDAKAIVVVIYLRLAGATQIPATAKLRDDDGNPMILGKDAMLAVGESGQTFVYEDTFGDYRIRFNEDEVSNLTYAFLYYAKNKKYNIGSESFSTTRLAKNVEISPLGFNAVQGSGKSTAKGIDIPSSAGYQTSLADEITVWPNSFSPLVYTSVTGRRYIISQNDTGFQDTVASIKNVVDDIVTFDSEFVYLNEFEIVNGQANGLVSIPLGYGSPEIWANLHKLYQINGGKDYYDRIFQYFSFSNFKNLLDTYNPSITWKSFQGGQPKAVRRFAIQVQDPNLVKLTSAVQNVPVNVTYNSKTVVGGYDYTEKQLQVPVEMYRYSGEYEAIFSPVSAFYQKTKIGDFEISGANCTIHIGINNSFVIPEFNHIKYSPKQILELENSPNYTAQFPIIDETPIGTSAFDMLASSWDKDYHFEYLTKSSRKRIFGTRRITEDYSFVSKLINVPMSLYMTEYTIAEVTQSQFRGTNFTAALNWAGYKDFVRFKLDTATTFAKNMSTAGLKAEFEKFFVDDNQTVIDVSPELYGELTLSQYVEEFAKQNLIGLYKIDEIQVWTKLDKSLPMKSVSFEQKTIEELVNDGYMLNKNVRINNQNSSVLEGSIDRPINAGIRVSFRIKIKFI